MSSTTALPDIVVPKGFRLHTENSAHLLLPDSNDAFLNPVQEFNRDLSVACIQVWGEQQEEQKKQRWLRNQEKQAAKETPEKRRKVDAAEGEAAPKEYRPSGIVILEALSATGLRSIRYAKEIPQVKYVLANDLSEAACEAMRRNVQINNLGPTDGDASTQSPAKVRINEGDACALMYSHRQPKSRVDVVDLDPYGTAAPFIDSAVQCIRDDGLLCVTCTDLAVLASGNFPEKCYANYGGVPVRGEYCHESSLRLVLSSIATAAARYGRFITPLLSLSIDFYVRLFIRIKTSPIEVKRLSSQVATYYICTSCQAYYEQPLGRIVEEPGRKASSELNLFYKTHVAPTAPQRCPECDSALHMAGPMWSAPIHDVDFELPVPFFFTPAKIAGYFRCEVPSLAEITITIARTWWFLKTTAPRSFVYDVMREWIKTHPVKMENVTDGQIARRLLQKEQEAKVSFEPHPGTLTRSSEVKLVRYQVNPTPNWGPKPKPNKRKRDPVENTNMDEAD
ncbi:tRNA (guanine(26)-N(2))-dimethyltransferase; AltName: Full=tRNA 2,2-dimethylguanosine-26 methyltransferase; AltName: Full=tRNA(guanine-26,N(2)-N(2)) methyltransferase; AltName: Full=tRNA(m(2,2)G26)dimethyltransferase [Serendipita indica DSM 11827]|nr:tRNA (guanine(26)-N(2))-dimethyltransferase; AltName: Full=tRNA 2,2-dimethylguanosine-26 methyltransferase; AltName: Full=tRNA(guanine-26,N(2)-N(2)) methyltransferase; AltName: Full=tRNA(m(2,2)G26)dimethyltransferase [Serendipita indica DSM 11827]